MPPRFLDAAFVWIFIGGQLAGKRYIVSSGHGMANAGNKLNELGIELAFTIPQRSSEEKVIGTIAPYDT